MQTVHLAGADVVASAGRSIRSAADEIAQASRNIDGSVERLGGMLQGALIEASQIADRIERAAHINVRAVVAAVAIAGMQAQNAAAFSGVTTRRYEEDDFLAIAEKLAKECGL